MSIKKARPLTVLASAEIPRYALTFSLRTSVFASSGVKFFNFSSLAFFSSSIFFATFDPADFLNLEISSTILSTPNFKELATSIAAAYSSSNSISRASSSGNNCFAASWGSTSSVARKGVPAILSSSTCGVANCVAPNASSGVSAASLGVASPGATFSLV
jgi:hypothetical protein